MTQRAVCEGEGQETSPTELSSKLTPASRELTSWRDAAQSAGRRAGWLYPRNVAHVCFNVAYIFP